MYINKLPELSSWISEKKAGANLKINDFTDKGHTLSNLGY